MPGSPPARKVMRRESLFGDCQACSPIAREISPLFTDHRTGDAKYSPRCGPSESLTVTTKTMPGEVQHDDDQHKHTNYGVEEAIRHRLAHPVLIVESQEITSQHH
jgi:hypothetical protein